MPRPKRADEKDAIYHALNRGNGRWTIFHKDADDKALDQIRWLNRRGSPLGQSTWVESIARRLDLQSTLRLRGRPKKQVPVPRKVS